jgi:hypothetical protein
MAARGTRRPHSRRVRSKPIRRSGGGSPGKGWGCPLSVLAPATVLLLVVLAVARL